MKQLVSGLCLLALLAIVHESVCLAQPAFVTEVIEGYLVTAPNGNQLWAKIIQPREDLYPNATFPAIISVPGGLGAGETGNLNLAAVGFVELHFNAEGRGTLHPSEGAEDWNGFIHQDDLKSVIEFAHTRPNVRNNNVGINTSSYGITMGTGCLSRYPDLDVKYLVDGEGPSESYVHCFEPWSLDTVSANDKINQGYAVFQHWSIFRDSSEANQLWWSEREPLRFIGNIRCRYLRVQAQYDHAQPPNAQWPDFDYPPMWYPCKHGIDLVNAATLGASPWTRVNGLPLGNPPNAIYSRESPPVYYSQGIRSHPGETQMILREMANMPPLSPSGLTIHVEDSASSVRLRWNSVPGVQVYRVFYDSLPEGEFQSSFDISAPDTTAAFPCSTSTSFYRVAVVIN